MSSQYHFLFDVVDAKAEAEVNGHGNDDGDDPPSEADDEEPVASDEPGEKAEDNA